MHPADSFFSKKDLMLIGKIPVRNIWLLMLYASEYYQRHEFGKFAIEENPEEIPDLIAEFLAYTVEHRIKRNLSYGYQSKQATLSRVRGRIDVLKTTRRMLLSQGRVACRFQELTVNTPRNRYVRAALFAISPLIQNKELAHRCRSLGNSMKLLGVSGEKPSRAEMSKDRIALHDVEDRLMLSAAHLAFNLALLTVSVGNTWLPLPQIDLHWIRHLFEKAIAGFYRVVLSSQGWQVYAGRTIQWQIDEKTAGIDSILPQMRTDIILEHVDLEQRIVIDTKFNQILHNGWYREKSLRSNYIYQIYTYLRSQENVQDERSLQACGLLLHPAVDQMVNETVKIQGHPIRFATVDLNTDPKSIRKQLLEVINFEE